MQNDISKRIIIGIIGHKSAGKTTVLGPVLHAYNFRRVHPAEPIREMLTVFLRRFGFPDGEILRYLDGDLKRAQIPGFPEGVTGTTLQQTLGTEWGRNYISRSVWTDLWKRRALQFPRVFNDSIRFPDEAKLILSLGGYLIRITRSVADNAEDHHVSESYIPHLPYHFSIANEGTPRDFDFLAQPVIHKIIAAAASGTVYPLQNTSRWDSYQ